MRVEVSGGNLGGAALDRLEHGVVDEDVLVLGLHHVVALRAQARHVTVDIDRLLVANPLQHRVDDDERPRPTDARTTTRKTSPAEVSKSKRGMAVREGDATRSHSGITVLPTTRQM